MDVSLPLRSLVPSLDSDVLAVLAGSESGFGITQVARLSGRGSRSGVEKVLDRLAQHGIVLAEPTNRGHLYRLNRQHLLVPALLAGLTVRRDLLVRLGEEVATLAPDVVHGSVFGSLARADGTPASDVDLLLVTSEELDVGDPVWLDRMRRLEDAVLAWTGNRLEMLVLDRGRLRVAAAEREPVVAEILRDAITLFGPDVQALLHDDLSARR